MGQVYISGIRQSLFQTLLAETYGMIPAETSRRVRGNGWDEWEVCGGDERDWWVTLRSFRLQNCFCGVIVHCSLKPDGLLAHHLHSQASGNPVRIGDGCATVTGYKLPRPLVHQTGKAGARFQARSQDTGLAVLVVVCDAVQPLRIIPSGNIALRQLLRQREG